MSVIFIFSGHARTSPFNLDVRKRNGAILKSYNDYLFTEEFKSAYNYKIYITADDIHLRDTIDYFTPEKIGNIHLLNTDFYLKPITQNIPNVDFFLKQYSKIDFKGNCKYEGSIYQHHKLLDCYNLFRNDGETPLFIVRLRLDIIIQQNILEILSLFEMKPELQICCNWDLLSVGKPDIMNCYCSGLENNYGKYSYNVPVPRNLPIMTDYHDICKVRCTYAAERQLFEMLFEYCNNHNLDINKTITSGDYSSIVR
jgi:hypothetical protein